MLDLCTEGGGHERALLAVSSLIDQSGDLNAARAKHQQEAELRRIGHEFARTEEHRSPDGQKIPRHVTIHVVLSENPKMTYVKRNLPAQKRLSDDEWAALLPLLSQAHTSERSVTVIHDVLVVGRPQSIVADEHGLSRAAISRIIKEAWDLNTRCGLRPLGWVNVNVSLPPEDAEHVYDMVRRAWARIRINNA